MLSKAEKTELTKIRSQIDSWGSDEFTTTHRLCPEVEIQEVLLALDAMIGPSEAQTAEQAQSILDGGGDNG